jgi:hypothetical protein
MKKIDMGHYTVMTKTVRVIHSHKWTERYDAVTPKYILTMSDGTYHMCNAAKEVFYTRLPNGDVEPPQIDPSATVVKEKVIRSHKVAVETIKDWYSQA